MTCGRDRNIETCDDPDGAVASHLAELVRGDFYFCRAARLLICSAECQTRRV
jgi:hypothetical protein